MRSPSVEGVIRGWRYEICLGTCHFCGEKDSVLVKRVSGSGGTPQVIEPQVCEHCVHMAGVAWRRVAGEVPPGFPEEDVTSIYLAAVLVARRRRVPDLPGELAPRETSSSYEFLTVPGDGEKIRDLPARPVSPGAPVWEAACKALESTGLRTWPALCETFHVGYTPRGNLAAVVLVRGYSHLENFSKESFASNGCEWSSWPISLRAGWMAGFYQFMEHEWPQRLYRHCVPADRLPVEVTVPMREVASRFVDLQSAVGAGKDVDTSMLSAYRAAMTADERAIADMVGEFEEKERAKTARKQLSAVPPKGSLVDDIGFEVKSFKVLEDEASEGEGEVGGEAGSDGQEPEPGFARIFKER
jgi:hypothetical protein